MTNSLMKLTTPLENSDSKFGYLNKKIKNILDIDDKNLRPLSQSKPISLIDNISKSLLIKKN